MKRLAIDTAPEPWRRDNPLGVAPIRAGLRFDETMPEAVFPARGKMIESPVLTGRFRERDIAAYRRAIREGLEVRFGLVPMDVPAAVRVITDEEWLKNPPPPVYTRATPDAFRRDLTPPPAPSDPTN